MAFNLTALVVFVLIFAFVTWLGFYAARWRKGDLDQLHEWGLGGRRFGTAVTWFLIGGDLYTAYTFIAVPATLYAGSAVGFFAVPYTIVVYPLIFLFLIASGLSLIFGVTRIVNFAHGSFYMLAAYLTYSLAAMLPGGAAAFYLAVLLAALAMAIAAMPEVTLCSAKHTKPLPNNSSNTPVIAALRHWRRVGGLTPRRRSHPYIAMPAAKKRKAAIVNGGKPVRPIRMPR